MAKKPTNEFEKSSVEIKYNFNEQELKGLADLISETIQKRGEIESEFKNIKTEYKGKLETLDSELLLTNEKYKQKFEMRDTPCYLYRNFDRGIRQYLSALDKTEVLKEEPLTKEDHQLKMDLDGKEEE